MKNLDDLTRELSQNNSEDHIKDIDSQFKEVENCLQKKSFIKLTAKKAIKEWNENDIKHWR